MEPCADCGRFLLLLTISLAAFRDLINLATEDCGRDLR